VDNIYRLDISAGLPTGVSTNCEGYWLECHTILDPTMLWNVLDRPKIKEVTQTHVQNQLIVLFRISI